MSSILEALKKLEDEKAVKQSGEAPITGKIVKEGRRAKKRPKWLLPAEMTAVAAVAVFATYLIMGGRSVSVRTAQEIKEKESIKPAPRTSKAPDTHPLGTPPPPPPTPPESHSPPPFRQMVKSPPSSRALVKSAPLEETAGLEPQTERVAPEVPVPPPREDTKPDGPSLKVTGIGWRKDSAERLAIVNGRPVSEGAIIDGAKVEEIFPDRVRFSVNGKTVVVPFDDLPGGTPK
jgi:general secretion pathway protein B